MTESSSEDTEKEKYSRNEVITMNVTNKVTKEVTEKNTLDIA